MTDGDKKRLVDWFVTSFDGAGCVFSILMTVIVVVGMGCVIVGTVCYWIKELR